VRQEKWCESEGESPSNSVMNRWSQERKNLMVESNQQPKTESCLEEGKELSPREGIRAERPIGSVDREKDRPQAGVALGLSKPASRYIEQAGGDGLLPHGIQHCRSRQGEAEMGLPGSKSVARSEGDTLNLGGPGLSRSTNYEGQAGRKARRKGERTEGDQGVGSSHISPQQARATGTEVCEGGDTS